MCYDIQSPTIEQLQAFSDQHLVGLDFEPADYTIYYHVNGYAHPRLPVLTGNQIRLLEWGLIPPEVKNASEAFSARNKALAAKAETIFNHPVFRQTIVRDRGILLAEGFFEWRDFDGKKYPYFIKGPELLTIGCTLAEWRDPATGMVHTTFSIVTAPAPDSGEPDRNSIRRIPLILADFKKWLDPGLQQQDIASMLVPFLGPLSSWTVSRKLIEMGEGQTNTPDISDPITYRELADH